MDKWQAQGQFWGSFGIPAYNEAAYFTKGDIPAYPHITYQSFGGRLDQNATLSVSLWYKEQGGAAIMRKADEIQKYMEEHEPICIRINEGYLWIKLPELVPFAQPIDSGVDNVKRIMLTVEAECLA